MVNEYTILNQLFSSKKMFLSLLTSFLVSFHLSSSQDIVGCGGFVQSNVAISFEKIEVSDVKC